MSEVCKNIDRLLKERGISGVKMSDDLGMSRSFMTELRKGRAKSIKIETEQKIADYFGVTTDYLFGKTNQSGFGGGSASGAGFGDGTGFGGPIEKMPTPEGERKPSDEDIKFALFGGGGEITDAMFDEVKNFAAYVKQREEEKRKG